MWPFKNKPVDPATLTGFEDQIEWMERDGWRVDLELNQYGGQPWYGKISKWIEMYHAADWVIIYSTKGDLEKVVDDLYLNARKSLPPKEMMSA